MQHEPLGALRGSVQHPTVWELQLERGCVKLSSPLEQTLRVRVVPTACTRSHYELAVLEHTPRELSYPSAIEAQADGLRVVVEPDGTLHVYAETSAPALERLFTMRSPGARAAGDGLLARPVALTPAHEPPATAGGTATPWVAGTRATLEVGPYDPFFGLGEDTGPMNRRDRVVTTWNSDTWPHTPSPKPLYSAFPFYLSRREVCREAAAEPRYVWYGVLCDNPARSRFDMGVSAPTEVRIDVEAGDLDLYVLAGPTPQDVVRRLGLLTGRLEMPPRWMLGFQQSRWSYYPDSRVLEVARAFREHRVPCDVLYIDIHYLDAYRAFTWHAERFPDPKGLVEALHALQFKVVVILNSAVAADLSFPIFAQGRDGGYFLTRDDGSVYTAEMWPGPAAFPDFTRPEVRAWWAGLHAELLAIGVDGVWNDMNEPTIFLDETKTFPESLMHACEGEPRPHLEVHNVYGMLMDEATLAGIRAAAGPRRLPLMTRAGYVGVQRYAFKWTGDNSSWWEHLPMSIAQVANLGVCGMPFCGPDIGGFNDDCSPELFARWMQMGVLFPYARAHSAQGTRDQEPWAFGAETLEISRRFVELRYRLLPYLYTLTAAMVRHGDLMLRPLYYQYPHDTRALQADDQFMLGADLLVAPIMAAGRSYRAVYLPEGWWMDWFDGRWYQGGQVMVAHADLARMPLYVRGGAVLPLAPSGAQAVADGPCSHVAWYVFVPPACLQLELSGWLYEDDGVSDPAGRAAGIYSELHLRGCWSAGSLSLEVSPPTGSFEVGPRQLEVRVVAGQALSGAGWLAESGCVDAWIEEGAGRQVRVRL
jgi:alpha-glucosidase